MARRATSGDCPRSWPGWPRPGTVPGRAVSGHGGAGPARSPMQGAPAAPQPDRRRSGPGEYAALLAHVPMTKDVHLAADAIDAYLEEVAGRLMTVLGDDLVGAYAGGSIALDEYLPGRSDVDVAVVT